jgi:hypothetical protein
MKRASNDRNAVNVPVMLSISDDSLSFLKKSVRSGNLDNAVSAVVEASVLFLKKKKSEKE